MTALTAGRNAAARSGDGGHGLLAATTRVFEGGMVAMATYGTNAGYIVPASADRTLKVLGHTAFKDVPTVGEDITSLAAGRYEVGFDRRPGMFANADSITAAHVGRRCYIVDDATVALSHNGHTRPVAGIIDAVTSNGVLVRFGDFMPSNGELVARLDLVAASAGSGQTDLTAAATTQVINLQASAPPGIYSVWYEVVTPFSGGAVSAATLDVGVTGDNTDAYVDGVDIFTAALSYRPGLGDGIGMIAHVSGSIAAIITTVDANVSVLDTGRVIIELRKIG